MDNKLLIAYVPVLHNGYKKFFEKHSKDSNSKLFIFGPSLIAEFDHLRKEIRALDPIDAVKAVKSLNLFQEVGMIDINNFSNITKLISDHSIIMPNEDVCRKFAERHLPNCDIIFDDIFLRWDRDYSVKEDEIFFDRAVSYEGLVKEMLDIGYEEAKKSSDWWRQVGAVAVQNNKIIGCAYNHHFPSNHGPYAFGDPRNNFHKGIKIELSTAIHAEAALISKIAGKKISLARADMYVTTFPCPPCAKLIAYSGVSRLFFHEGYSMVNAQEDLKRNNVEIIYVKK